MKQTFRRFVILLSALVLAGCATLPPYRAMYRVETELKSFFKQLQNQEYEASYEFFSDELRTKVSVQQHIDMMNLLRTEFGAMKSFKFVVPRGVFLHESIFKDPFRGGESIIMNYRLSYEKEPVTVRISVIKINESRYLLDGFLFTSKSLQTEQLINKIRALGIDVSSWN